MTELLGQTERNKNGSTELLCKSLADEFKTGYFPLRDEQILPSCVKKQNLQCSAFYYFRKKPGIREHQLMKLFCIYISN